MSAAAAADAFLVGDLEVIGGSLTDAATLHSPVVDYTGRSQIMPVLAALAQVVRDPRSTSTFEAPGESAVLFTALIGGREAQGLLHVAEAAGGGVGSMTLMIRPLELLLDGVQRMRQLVDGAPPAPEISGGG